MVFETGWRYGLIPPLQMMSLDATFSTGYRGVANERRMSASEYDCRTPKNLEARRTPL